MGKSISITTGLRTISALLKLNPNCRSASARFASDTKKHRRANESAFRNRAAISSEGQTGKLECAMVANGHLLSMHISTTSIGEKTVPFDMTTRSGEALPNEHL